MNRRGPDHRIMSTPISSPVKARVVVGPINRRVESVSERTEKKPAARHKRPRPEVRVPIPAGAIPPRRVLRYHYLRGGHVRFRLILRAQFAPGIQGVSLIPIEF